MTSAMLRNVIKHLWRYLWHHLSRILTLNKFLFICKSRWLYSVTNTPLSSFIYFRFGLKHGKLVNCKSSKKYKIKENLIFFSKYQIYVISWVENIEIFTPAAHSWKFWCFQHTRWNIHLKKVNILYLFLSLKIVLWHLMLLCLAKCPFILVSSILLGYINRGSYMSAHVLLNLLNELRKRV